MKPTGLTLLSLSFALFLLVLPVHGQNTRENADFKLAVNLYNDGLYDLAVEQLKQFISAYPTTSQGIEARFTLGLAQQKLKKFDDARVTFQAFAVAFQDHPKAPEAWWHVGESYAALQNDREAALAFERVKVFHPHAKQAPDALVQASVYFQKAGEPDNARRTLRVLLQEYATSGAAPGARMRLAQMAFAEGAVDQARQELRKIVENNPTAEDRAAALIILGNIARDEGRIAQAEAHYQEVTGKLAKTTSLPQAQLRLGLLYGATGRLNAAVELLKKAAGTDSSLRREALLGIAEAETDLNDDAAAATTYEKALSPLPDAKTPRRLILKFAEALARSGQFRRSDELCSLLAGSDREPLLGKRAILLMAANAQAQGNNARSAQLRESFVEQFPDDAAAPGVLFTAALTTLNELHNVKKATTLFEQVPARFPASPFAPRSLFEEASALSGTETAPTAVALYRQIVSQYPSAELAPDAQRRADSLETFVVRNRDEAVEQLSLVVGEIIAGGDKADLTFRLGQLYFNNMKNYSGAAIQFSTALEEGLKPEHAAEAIYLKARSLDILSRSDTSRIREAREAYRSYLTLASTHAHADDAMRALFLLSAVSIRSAREAAAPLLDTASTFKDKGLVSLTLGLMYEKNDSLTDALHAFRSASQAGAQPATREEGLFRCMTILTRLGRSDSALAAGDTLLARFPRGRYAAQTLWQMGRLALDVNAPARAASCYQRLTGAYGYTEAGSHAALDHARALYAAGSFAEAAARYDAILRERANDPSVTSSAEPVLHLEYAQSLFAAHSIAAARLQFLAVVQRSQTGMAAGEAYTRLGMISQADGDREAATAYFRQAEAASPGAAATREVADLLFASGAYDDARTQYAQLSQHASNDTIRAAYDARAILSRLRGARPAEADREIAAFVGKYPADVEDAGSFALEKALVIFRSEDFPKALEALRHVVDTYGDTRIGTAARFWTAKALDATGKPAEAQKMLEQLLADAPHDPIVPRIHFALGTIAFGAEQWTEAVRRFRQIVDDPHADTSLLPSAINNLIETYEMTQAFDGALALARRYLELYPNADDVLDKKIKIGILYTKLGYFDQAILHLQALLEEAPGDVEGELRYYIGEANYNKGDFQQAILEFLKVPYLVTRKGKIDWTANAFYMAGQSYERMSRFDQALAMYQQIVDRTGIDESFRSAARKEIDRVRSVTNTQKK